MSKALQRLVLHETEHTSLPSGWHWRRLEDVATLLKPGKVYDEGSVGEEGEVPVVNQSADRFHGFHDNEPDVIASPERPVFTFANHTCAMRLMKRPYSSIQNIFSRVGKSGVSDTVFLYYVVLRRLTLSGYKGHHPIYRRQWVPIPPLPVQLKITSILSAYDDLIENNRRRIQLLEQSARLLYKEWFVHLRFPGHEHTTITNGIPKGWEKKQVKDILGNVKRPRKILKTEFLDDGPIPCIDQSRDFIGGYTDDEKSIVDIGKPVIVFGDHTRILKFVDFPFASGADGTQLIVSNDKSISQEFLYFALDSIDLSNYFYARHFKFLKDQYIPKSTNAILAQFASNVRPILKQIKSLRVLCHHLAKAREWLLPKLMNGAIDTG